MANAKQRRKAAERAQKDQAATKKQNDMKSAGGGGAYAKKVAQRKIGQRSGFEAREGDIRADVGAKADWEIQRDAAKGSRGPAKPKPAPRPVKEEVLQTMFFRGPAGMETELEIRFQDTMIISPVKNENSPRIATSLLAVKIGEQEGENWLGKPEMLPVWEIKRLSGFKAANEGLKSAEMLAEVTAPESIVRQALERWSLRYGHTEVASTMASPMAGASVVQRPNRGSERHHRM